ncbi:MAG: hypothetical protein ACI9FZ_000588 [Bacteroidia bacterium]|jgi:hypothetical protein
MGLMPRSLLRLILEGNALSFPTTGQANPARRVKTTARFPPAEWLGACPEDNDRRSTGGIYPPVKSYLLMLTNFSHVMKEN